MRTGTQVQRRNRQQARSEMAGRDCGQGVARLLAGIQALGRLEGLAAHLTDDGELADAAEKVCNDLQAAERSIGWLVAEMTRCGKAGMVDAA